MANEKFKPATRVIGEDQAGILIQLIEAERPERGAALRPLAEITATVRAAISTAKKDKGLTDYGKQQAASRALADAREALKVHEDELSERRERTDKTREQALNAYGATANAERVREIRDEIRRRKVPDLQVGADLLRAVDTGDVEYVKAVMSAPASFPVTGDEWVNRAKDAVVSRSPLAERLATEQQAADELAGVVGAVKADLTALEGTWTPAQVVAK
jgi:hypothetical protein